MVLTYGSVYDRCRDFREERGMMIVYNGDRDSKPFMWKFKIWEYLYRPSACEWIVPGTYEAFE